MAYTMNITRHPSVTLGSRESEPGPQIGFVLRISPPPGPRPIRQPLPIHPSPPKFGFVLRISPLRGLPRHAVPLRARPARLLSIRNPQSAIGKLGSFCTFHFPAEPRPTWQLPLPTHPSPPKFGFVLHVYPLAGAKLGLFCAFAVRYPAPGRAKLGSFCAFAVRWPAPAEPNWVRFARMEFEVSSLKSEVRAASSSLNT
jgi:hypothetical protein